MLYILILRQEMCIGMSVNLGVLVKRQGFHCPHPEVIWGSKGIAALILDLDTPGKKPVYPFVGGWVCPIFGLDILENA